MLADARDLDPAERDALALSQVRRVPADPAAITAALDELRGTPVYLHVDVDVIDSTQLPGLRFPAGPGPAVGQIEECLAAVCATADVIAACIACAWLPDHVSDSTARETITRLARAIGADLGLALIPRKRELRRNYLKLLSLRKPFVPLGRLFSSSCDSRR